MSGRHVIVMEKGKEKEDLPSAADLPSFQADFRGTRRSPLEDRVSLRPRYTCTRAGSYRSLSTCCLTVLVHHSGSVLTRPSAALQLVMSDVEKASTKTRTPWASLLPKDSRRSRRTVDQTGQCNDTCPQSGDRVSKAAVEEWPPSTARGPNSVSRAEGGQVDGYG